MSATTDLTPHQLHRLKTAGPKAFLPVDGRHTRALDNPVLKGLMVKLKNGMYKLTGAGAKRAGGAA